jgi:hypothetical protein
MAKLSAHGEEIGRLLVNGGQAAYMSDGTILFRSIYHGWKVRGRRKAEVSLQDWIELKRARIADAPEWRRVRNIPGRRTLEAWLFDSVCETPSGDLVEPDGIGPDGAPSWLRLLGLV